MWVRKSKDVTIRMILIAIPSTGLMPSQFVECLLDLVSVLQSKKIKFRINIKTGSFLPHVRAKACGGSRDRGLHQIPFNSPDITHILMLDSDIIFKPEDVLELIDANKLFVAGMYSYHNELPFEKNKRQVIAGFWDEKYFVANGGFPSITPERAKLKTLGSDSKLMPVDWVGLGFVLVSASIFEKIEYPWFDSEKIIIENLIDSTSEDVGFCRKLTKAGVVLYLHTEIHVGHLKSNLV